MPFWPFSRAAEIAQRAAPVLANPARLLSIGFAGPRAAVSYDKVVKAYLALCHPSVHKCVTKLAQSVQTVDWVVIKSKRSALVAEDMRNGKVLAAIQSALDRPAQDMTGAQARYLMAMYLALFGRVYLVVTRDSAGIPSGFYLLSPARVDEVVNKQGLVVGFKFKGGVQSVEYPTKDVATGDKAKDTAAGFKPYVVKIEIPMPDAGFPDGMTRPSNTPLNGLGLPMQVVTMLLERAVDTASGHPNSKYIVTSSSLLTREQEKEIENALAARQPGEEQSGRILFMAGADMKTTKLDSDLSDLHSKVPLDDMERRIASAFGIPPAILGLNGQDGSKFAQNYSESRIAFWEDTIEPAYLAPIEEGLTEALCPPGWSVTFKRSSVPAMQDAIAKRLATLEAISTLTLEEKRAFAGAPPPEAGAVMHSPKAPAPADKPAATPSQ